MNMATLYDDLSELLSNPPYMMSAYGYYIGELGSDEYVAKQVAGKALAQWIKDVEAVLDIAEADRELQTWRNVTQDIDFEVMSEERLKAVLRRIVARFQSTIPPKPHDDMPDSLIQDYEEARNVFPYSARSTAALLRLVLQKLCKELGEKGKDINDDIKNLVKKGVPEYIQQSLDIVRIVGNESVHPGVIDVHDNPEIALELFDLVNGIVEELISKKKRINESYNKLPQSKRDAIRDRDKGSTSYLK